ncbi:MAG: gamma-glutamylputrescine oxidase [Cyclobacteriaceae bacterium]|jgi:gamma-glutamylputrescine oxidase
MISIWEQESFLSYDTIIVGAGISGLSTAASLKEKDPNHNILVLERGLLPTGASTKNAGFACFGSISELSQDRKTLGDTGMIALVNQRWNGLQKTISRLGEDKIGLERKGGYEMIDDATECYLNELDETNELLKPIFDSKTFSLCDKQIEKFGFRNIKHLVYNSFEGQLHTGKLMKSLWEYCNELGIHILTGAHVDRYESTDHGVDVICGDLKFQAKSLAFCTNAFANELLGDQLEIKPGRGMVMLIKPSKKLRLEGTFHYQEGYYYFRDFGGKLIFGGGRNLDFEGETTTEFGLNQKIEDKLHTYLREVILPDSNYETELRWSGIMAFGENKSPIVRKISDHIFVGVRLGGMGVAIGSMVGEDLANLILKTFN